MSNEDFISRYLYDSTNPDSVLSNLLRAYDNAVVLINAGCYDFL